MSRIKKSLVSQIKEKQEFDKQQNELKRKHGIEEKNVIVVEKSNMTKFLIRTIGNLIRISATIIILILASVGLTTLLYPHIRNEFLTILYQIMNQMISFFQQEFCNSSSCGEFSDAYNTLRVIYTWWFNQHNKKEATAIAPFHNFKLQLYLTINKNSIFIKQSYFYYYTTTLL